MKEEIVSVGTTATKILDMNPSRKAYILQNQGTVTVSLGITKNVATSGTRTGRKLAADVLEFVKKADEPKLVTQELYGIVASGTCNVWVWTE